MRNNATTRVRRGVTAVAGVAIAALVLSACSAQGGGAADPIEWKLTATTPAPSGNIDSITWASYAEPYTLDYAYAFDYADNSVLANVCESLLRLNPDFTLSPGLAESFENPTPTTWVYQIRDGVKFHDGTTLTADDVVASMNRIIDPEVGSAWYSVYQNVATIEKTGDMEVTVTTTIPDSQFNQGLGGSAGVIESAATLTKLGLDYGNSTGGVNCTGPFQFDNWKSGESISLKKFDGYWDKDLVAKASNFKIVFMNDATARINALKSGEVDGSWMIPLDAASQLQNTSNGDLLFGLNTAVSSLVISNLDGPLGDLRVRKALLMAIDREGISKAATSGIADVTDALTTKSVWGLSGTENAAAAFGDIEDYPFDIEAAKKLVKEAGVGNEQITLVTAPISQEFAVISQAVAAAGTAIGLNMKIETVTPNAYTALFSDPSARDGVDLFYTSWYLSSPDPLEMYSVLRTGDFSNYGDWSNPKFDALVIEAGSTMDAEARGALTAQAQILANAELPWLPLYEIPMAVYMGDRITGLSPSVAHLYYPWAAELGAR